MMTLMKEYRQRGGKAATLHQMVLDMPDHASEIKEYMKWCDDIPAVHRMSMKGGNDPDKMNFFSPLSELPEVLEKIIPPFPPFIYAKMINDLSKVVPTALNMVKKSVEKMDHTLSVSGTGHPEQIQNTRQTNPDQKDQNIRPITQFQNTQIPDQNQNTQIPDQKQNTAIGPESRPITQIQNTQISTQQKSRISEP